MDGVRSIEDNIIENGELELQKMKKPSEIHIDISDKSDQEYICLPLINFALGA
jgi:hypothetical protein